MTRSTRRLALTVDEAADTINVSRDTFERHIMPELCLVRIGRLVRVPRSELERWLTEHAMAA